MLRLLLFSDIHCDLAAVERLVEQARGIDIAIGAGDFANMGQQLQPTIDALSEIACPTILVPGNGETLDALKAAVSNWEGVHVLHGNGVEVSGVKFFGIGGGIPETPFGTWSFDFSETEAQSLLTDCPRNGVLVSHSPAKGLLDRSSKGQNIGSVSVLNTIDRCEPQLMICGHVHACGGQTMQYGSTKIVNAGPNGIIVEL
jgi:uncharacterized protein